jgi:hypothetical protein
MRVSTTIRLPTAPRGGAGFLKSRLLENRVPQEGAIQKSPGGEHCLDPWRLVLKRSAGGVGTMPWPPRRRGRTGCSTGNPAAGWGEQGLPESDHNCRTAARKGPGQSWGPSAAPAGLISHRLRSPLPPSGTGIPANETGYAADHLGFAAPFPIPHRNTVRGWLERRRPWYEDQQGAMVCADGLNPPEHCEG